MTKTLFNVNSKNIYLILTTLFLSTCCFICHLTKPFQPLYLFFFPMLGYYLVIIAKQKFLKISKSQYLCLLCILYWLTTNMFQVTFSFAPINVAISMAYYFLGIEFLKTLSIKQTNKICKYTIGASLAYILLETIIRIQGKLSLVLIAYVDMYTRGLIKVNSFMSIDSNMVAIYLLTLCFLSYYMYKNFEHSKFYLFSCIISICLTFTTISRAALVVLFLTLLTFNIFTFIKTQVLQKLIRKKMITLKLLLVLPFIILILMFFILKLIMFFASDYSLGTKLDLINETFAYIYNVPFYNLLFGLGTDLDVISLYFDRATHLFITSYLVYYGLISLLLLVIFWWQIIVDTKKKALFIILPTLLLGFSICLPSCQIFYVSLAFIYYFEKNRIKTRKDIKCQKYQ